MGQSHPRHPLRNPFRLLLPASALRGLSCAAAAAVIAQHPGRRHAAAAVTVQHPGRLHGRRFGATAAGTLPGPPLRRRDPLRATAMPPPLSSRSTRFRGRRDHCFRGHYRHSGCHGQYITTPCCEVSSCT